MGIVLLVFGYNADSTGNGDVCCYNQLSKFHGNGSSACGHKADKAKPRRALLQSIENVLEHTLAGVSKYSGILRQKANEN